VRRAGLWLAVAAAAGLAVGATLTRWLGASGPDTGSSAIVRDIMARDGVADAATDSLRDTGYATLSSVEAVFGLPTPFIRREALYALAGRADSAGLQRHIAAAERIADDRERDLAVGILFSRLAEIDPPSALALAQSEPFRGYPGLEGTVWGAWARADLDDALFAAKTLTRAEDQHRAAQALYLEFGGMGNAVTDRIHAELGVAPDALAREAYLKRLADTSPGEAVDWIERVTNTVERQALMQQLAEYLAWARPGIASSVVAEFQRADDRQYFETVLNTGLAQVDPHAAIEAALSGHSMDGRTGFFQAIQVLGSTDPDALEGYFHRATSAEMKRYLAMTYLQATAADDPAAALAWFERYGQGDMYPDLLRTTMLTQIATVDPELALREAQSQTGSVRVVELVGQIMSQVAQQDPQRALALRDLITNTAAREQATSMAVMTWLQADPDAALAWIDASAGEATGRLLGQAMWPLMHSDLDAALRLYGRLDAGAKEAVGQNLVFQLAQHRSVDEALAFAEQFVGQPGHGQMVASVVGMVAMTDPGGARQLADRISDPQARSGAYMGIATQVAQRDPRAAADMLPMIDSGPQRQQAVWSVVDSWYRSDPSAFASWVDAAADPADRDPALARAAEYWEQDTARAEAMIGRIQDDAMRVNATIGLARRLAQTDREAARRLLDGPEIPDYAREEVLRNFGPGFWHID